MYIRNVLIAGFAAASTVEAYGNSTIREEQKIWDVAHLGAPKGKRFLDDIFNMVGGILGGSGGGGDDDEPQCPEVWSQISKTLTEQFLGDGQCTDAARAAIRASFHDCFNGACDGSLILANECSNTENRGMERLCSNLANVATHKPESV
ncbi:Peroxidase 40 [Pyrenophora tritici-repentis]|nr:Peroxidase 40 [Pyrenophora tritici-repentis]